MPTKAKLGLFVGAALVSASTAVLAGKTVGGPMAFDAIPQTAEVLSNDWDQPHIIPEGYEMFKDSDETDLNIYPDPQDDLTDMNAVNETGRLAGRFLYRTQEVDNGGAVSVVDLRTEATRVIAQATDGDPADFIGPTFPELTTGKALDGIRWTPLGTLLFAEEDPLGKLYEMYFDKKDPSVAVDVTMRDKVGLTCHEGIETDADGAVYVVNEFNGGSIFKFVPASYGNLSSGRLYALQIQAIAADEQLYAGGSNNAKHLGAFEWVALDESNVLLPDSPSCADGIQAAADAVDATLWALMLMATCPQCAYGYRSPCAW